MNLKTQSLFNSSNRSGEARQPDAASSMRFFRKISMLDEAHHAMGAAAVALIAIVACLAFGTTPSEAAVSPPPVSDATFSDPLWTEVSGMTWPDTFPAEWAAPAMDDAAVAAGAMPALAAIGTIVLAAGAFDVGWRIGRVIDTKWLHLSDTGSEIGVYTRSTDVFAAMTSFTWVYYPSFSPHCYSTSYCTPPPLHDGKPVWVLRWNNSWPNTPSGTSFRFPCGQVGDYYYPCSDLWYSTPSDASMNDAKAKADAIPGAHFTVYATSATNGGCNGRYNNGTWRAVNCGVYWIDAADMTRYLIHSTPVPYTNQSRAYTTNIAAPVKNDTTLSALRNSLAAAGPAVENEINASLDPLNWARPGANGMPVGGAITNWIMPNCTAFLPADCESFVTAAAAAANNPAPSFSVTASTADAARIPGAILAETPSAGESGRPTSIALATNPDPLNGFTSAEGGSGGRGDDGSRPTGGGSEECDFDDFADTASWQTLISQPGGDIYLEACADAWAAVRAAGLVDAFNFPDPLWALADNPEYAVPAQYLWDESLREALTADGSSISDWVKIKSPQFETDHGPAEMHVMRNIRTGQLYLERGWKLVFKLPF